MVKGKKGNGSASDLTVEILKQIRDNTAATTKAVAEVKAAVAEVKAEVADLNGRTHEVENKLSVLIEGQHDLAKNVAQLNVAMLRVITEIKDLRDEKYRSLELRLARLEKQAGIDD